MHQRVFRLTAHVGTADEHLELLDSEDCELKRLAQIDLEGDQPDGVGVFDPFKRVGLQVDSVVPEDGGLGSNHGLLVGGPDAAEV